MFEKQKFTLFTIDICIKIDAGATTMIKLNFSRLHQHSITNVCLLISYIIEFK